MEIILAETAGFCFGVKRAIDTVYEKTSGNIPIYTFGPIIHNEEVVKDLENKGVHVIDNIEEISTLTSGIVIIRSHGVSKELYDEMSNNKNITLVDCTCPFVKRIHNICYKDTLEGKNVIVIGDAGHPEVDGIQGWCNGKSIVINNIDEANSFYAEKDASFTVVSQTTFNENKFKELVDILKKMDYDINVVNTICNATSERQEEAAKVAGMVDMMIVIGGKSSSNSKKLFEICKEKCENTVFIQTADDLKNVFKGDARVIGITAGASTPKNIIEEVQSYVRRNDI